MTLCISSGSFCLATTAIRCVSAPDRLPASLDIAPKLKLWQKARDMFKLRRKKNKQAFFPRPAKPEKALKPEGFQKAREELQKAKEELWAANVIDCFKPKQPPECKSPFECGISFGNFLEKKGFKRLGSGTFSTVFCKGDSQRVIKVCHRLDAWMDYIAWSAKKGYCGTYAPRVYSYKYFKGITSPFYVAVVERLEKTYGMVEDQHPQAFAYTAFKWNLQHSNDNAQQLLDLLSPGLSKFTVDVKDFAKNHSLDLHSGNFMVRKDGSFVATDPIMGHQQFVSTNRLRTKDFTGSFAAPLERLAA